MTRHKTRAAPCGPSEASARLAQAAALIMVADLVLGDDTSTATPGVAAALAVLAGIAAADAACCAALKQRSRGQSHADAIRMIAAVAPHGPEMAKDLARVLERKDDAHYGVALLGRADAEKLVRLARRLLEKARAVVPS